MQTVDFGRLKQILGQPLPTQSKLGLAARSSATGSCRRHRMRRSSACVGGWAAPQGRLSLFSTRSRIGTGTKQVIMSSTIALLVSTAVLSGFDASAMRAVAKGRLWIEIEMHDVM